MTPPPPIPHPTPKADSGAAAMCETCPFRFPDLERETLLRMAAKNPHERWPCHEDDPDGTCLGRECVGHKLFAAATPPQSDPAMAAAEEVNNNPNFRCNCGHEHMPDSKRTYGVRGMHTRIIGETCEPRPLASAPAPCNLETLRTALADKKAQEATAPAPEGRGETGEGDALFPTPGSVEWDEFIESHENLEEVLITAVISARRLERERDGLARWKEDHERILDLSNKFFREARRSVAHLLDDPQTGQEGICRNLLRIAAERDAAVAQAQALREAVAKIAGDGTWDTIMCDNDEQGCSCVEFATKTLKALAASEAGK